MQLRLGSRQLDLRRRALVMGVLERGPGARLDGGGGGLDALVRRAGELVAEGADLLEVVVVGAAPGGEASESEELEWLVPAVEALRQRVGVPLSCGTRRASVAAAAYAAGAVVGNDRSGFPDPDYLPAAHRAGATVVATHVGTRRGHPRRAGAHDDVVADAVASLGELARRAGRVGLPADRVVLAVGLERGETWQRSLALLRGSAALADLGHPLLLSVPDESLLGRIPGLAVERRRLAAHAAHALGVIGGCRLLRAHDVRGARRVADVLAALVEPGADRAHHEVVS